VPGEYEYKIDLANGGAEVRVAELRCVFRLRVIDWPRKRGETSKESAVMDRDRLRLPVVLRNWRPGDRLRPLGHQNARKLKRLLNEKHISRWKREGWPVLTSGGILAWARGFPVAVEFAADERTRAGMVVAEEAW
jgi:tRNA(Ile)-lysidine synthase